jgi:serine/threonine-protein kinase
VANCKEGSLLPVPLVLSIVARVAEALAYAHQQNVVHRDIKPANIMFDPDSDTVKVTDFGIARITDSSKTKTGLVLGTPSFMSPEQLAGKKVDGRSDLYSLGVMLFQMLAGVLPFRGESMAELMYKIANEAPPDVGNWRNDLPPQLGAIVSKAMSKDAQARYQDGRAFADELRGVLRGLSGSAAPGVATANSPTVSAATAGSERTQPVPAQDATAFATTMFYQPESPDAANTAKPGSAQNGA